jgi:hypothetical protein
MEIFNMVTHLPSDQKKAALQRELNRLLASKVIKSVSLDPMEGTLMPLIHLSCTDGTNLTVAQETTTMLDLSPESVFTIRVNGDVVAKL